MRVDNFTFDAYCNRYLTCSAHLRVCVEAARASMFLGLNTDTSMYVMLMDAVVILRVVFELWMKTVE